MQAFMQSLQIRCPVAAHIGLSITMVASAEIARPWVFRVWNSEIFSSSGQPASVTPKALFWNVTLWGASAEGFSRCPVEHESLPWVWDQMD
jgi:hypothetical protein